MRRRLAVMMFLQYAALGAWAVTLPTLLMAQPHEGGLCLSGQQVGLIFATYAIAAIGSPFVVGLLADRFFAAQRLFAVLHLTSALILLVCCVFVVWQREELRFELNKAAMCEEKHGSLWRDIWERDSVQAFLEHPSTYQHG